MEETKNNLTQNLTFFRKKAGLTQSELASKLNYSDKSISKWERGDGVPDIFVLDELAKLYNISVDSLINGSFEDSFNIKTNETLIKKILSKKKLLICLISVAVVWLLATLFYIFPSILTDTPHKFWLVFIYAIPLSFLIVAIFTSVWHKYILSTIFFSLFSPTFILAFFLTLPLKNMWLIFILIAPIQAVIILFHYLKINNYKLSKK